MFTTMHAPAYLVNTHTISSKNLKRKIALDVYLPNDLMGHEELHLLLLNDGQDGPALGLKDTLTRLYLEQKLKPVVVVAIHAGDDRINEYGIAGHPDFKGRGSKATAYTKFILAELLPFIDDLALNINGRRGFAGFSLGGLSAMDIVLHNSAQFSLSGVFSGSFWWRSRDLTKGYTDADRIMHQVIRDLPRKENQQFWIMAGTEDEASDRNNNFIIDSIDDSIDIVKELLAKGYERRSAVAYVEIVGGRHDMPTWGKAMPLFLTWAFGR